MRDEDKSKEQLLTEIRSLRREIETQRGFFQSRKEDFDAEQLQSDTDIGELKTQLTDSREETDVSQRALARSEDSRLQGESDLADAQERYNVLGDIIPFGFWTADNAGRIDFLSKAFLKMRGIHLDDPSLANWVEELSRPILKSLLSDWTSSFPGRDIWEGEHRVTGQDGKEYTILVRGVPILDENGNAAAWLGINLDISSRRRLEDKLSRQANKMAKEIVFRQEAERVNEVERALRKSEERFRVLFENAGDAIFVHEFEGRFVDVNHAACERLGYTKEELLQLTPQEIESKEAARHVPQQTQTIQRQGKAFFHSEHMTKDGQTIPVEINARTIESQDKKHILSIVRDISERVESEKALRESEERFRTMADGLPLVVWVHDSRGNQIYVNKTFKEYYGLSEEDIQAGKWKQMIDPETGPPYVEELVSSISEQRSFYGQVKVKRTDGKWRWVESWGKPRFTASGEYLGMVGASADVTARIRLEKALADSMQRTKEANEAKSTFLTNMSHEIRTPLNAIVGMLNLIKLKTKDSSVCKYVNLADKSAAHLLDLINDVLDLSKINAGKAEIENKVFSLGNELESVISPLTTLALDKGVDLGFSIHESIPKWLIGDPNRLRQVLMNLIGNAIKFTEQGEVIITVNLDEQQHAPGKAMLLFKVTDTGIGIQPDQLDKIFEVFEQAATSAHSLYGGTGLGLAISKQLVELMGGELSVQSTPGEGSTFSFSLELEVSEKEPESDPLLKRNLYFGKSLRILVAEDNKVNQLYMVDMLESEGHNVVLAENGKEVLEKLADDQFDVILMDINMPEMRGDEATEIIRNHTPEGVDPHVPIVALTAYAMDEEIRAYNKAGFTAYLTKPVRFEELSNILAAVVDS